MNGVGVDVGGSGVGEKISWLGVSVISGVEDMIGNMGWEDVRVASGAEVLP